MYGVFWNVAKAGAADVPIPEICCWGAQAYVDWLAVAGAELHQILVPDWPSQARM